MKPSISGEWYRSETPFGPMFHGRLGIAEANSGKLVALLRSKARGLAQNQNWDIVIIDGPPGIGCPTIASLMGSDYVLLVTEPTLSAFHDLRRIADLIRHFNLTAGICINKFDINASVTDQIKEFAERSGFDMLGTLPYDDACTGAQIAGKTVIEYTDGPVSRHLHALWSNIRQQLHKIEMKKPAGINTKIENPKSDGV
jgi:MinD superfamily P-loop ATPase